jgi:hypothetical protein
MWASEAPYIQFADGGLEKHAKVSAMWPVLIRSLHADTVFINTYEIRASHSDADEDTFLGI